MTVPGSQPRNETVLTLEGPSGKVTLKDEFDNAKKAFPAPPGAQVFNSPMSFSVLAKSGWGWGLDSNQSGFEVAAKDGKVVALALTSAAKSKGARSGADLGKPSREATGKTCEMKVWESGDSARIEVLFNGSSALLQNVRIILVGAKSDLALLNYRADDPDTFVKQQDAAAAQMDSPELRKVFEDAKARALAKQGKK